MTDDGIWLTSIAIAKRLGIRRNTWASYVSRGQAPEPDWLVDNKPLWKVSTIEKWENDRPGSGRWNK